MLLTVTRFQLEILRSLYDVRGVIEFQKEILDAIGEIAPETRQAKDALYDQLLVSLSQGGEPLPDDQEYWEFMRGWFRSTALHRTTLIRVGRGQCSESGHSSCLASVPEYDPLPRSALLSSVVALLGVVFTDTAVRRLDKLGYSLSPFKYWILGTTGLLPAWLITLWILF